MKVKKILLNKYEPSRNANVKFRILCDERIKSLLSTSTDLQGD